MRVNPIHLLTATLAMVLLPTPALATACPSTPSTADASPSAWGLTLESTRFEANTGIDRDNVASLELKWAYGLAEDGARTWPLVTEDTVFLADPGRGLVALDRETGCERWLHENDATLASAIVPARTADGRLLLIVTERFNAVLALDASNGEVAWRSNPADNPRPMYSGTPIVQGEVIVVPISSMEIGLAMNPLYSCCKTAGAVAAIRTDDGERLWHHRTIEQEAESNGRRWLVMNRFGPSGAPVWGAPTLDEDRGVVFVGTGQNYSYPTTDTSDAILALDVATGAVRWKRQFTANDAFNMACSVSRDHPNCPDPIGPDVDFGAPPMLLRGETDRLVVAQKSGDVYALDPDTGEPFWHRDLARGGALGGIHWGIAANASGDRLYVPVSDMPGGLMGEGQPVPGTHALDAATGETLWFAERSSRCEERRCWGGVSAAVTATPGLVFTASLDGWLEALDADTGEVLWAHDSWTEFDSVNGVETRGGAYDTNGPLIVEDEVFVVSGYEGFGQEPGNAFLVFSLPDARAL